MAGLKCTGRMVQNWLQEVGLKSCKARKKSFINEKQKRVRLRFAKDHKDQTGVKLSSLISPICSKHPVNS